MMFASAALLLTVSSTAPSFADVKAKATHVDRLAPAAQGFIGRCPDMLTVDELALCQKNLADKKAGKAGAALHVVLGTGGDVGQLTFEKMTDKGARFVWAPLLDLGNGLAVTVGNPLRLDGNGHVMVQSRPFEGAPDAELLDSDLLRAAQTQQVAVEAVLVLKKPWELGVGAKRVTGVAVELKALRFFHARTGKTLLETTAP
jgi:hypothetical protein